MLELSILFPSLLNGVATGAIYALIAGTYTPFLLVLIRGGWGWSLFGVLWGLTAAGFVFKVMFVHRFAAVSTAIYVALGWIGRIARQFGAGSPTARGFY